MLFMLLLKNPWFWAMMATAGIGMALANHFENLQRAQAEQADAIEGAIAESDDGCCDDGYYYDDDYYDGGSDGSE